MIPLQVNMYDPADNREQQIAFSVSRQISVQPDFTFSTLRDSDHETPVTRRAARSNRFPQTDQQHAASGISRKLGAFPDSQLYVDAALQDSAIMKIPNIKPDKLPRNRFKCKPFYDLRRMKRIQTLTVIFIIKHDELLSLW